MPAASPRSRGPEPNVWQAFVDRMPRVKRPKQDGPVRLVCFDMDGVLTRQESSWVSVHHHFGVDNGPGFEAFLAGGISDQEFIRRDVALWLRHRPQMTIDDVHAILDSLTLVKGGRRACQRLHDAGVALAIVSGGLEYAAQRVAGQLGIQRISANGLHSAPDGRLTGTGYVNTPLADKSAPVRRFARQANISLGQVASVGNSAPDVSMFRASGLGIAFRPSDGVVRSEADMVVPGDDLRAVAEVILAAS